MRFKRWYRYRNLVLEIHSNQKVLYPLIDYVLTPISAPRDLKNVLKIEFYLDHLDRTRRVTDEQYLYQGSFEKQTRLSVSLSSKIADVNTDAHTRKVFARFHAADLASKERLVDLAVMEPIRVILAHHGYYFLHASMAAHGKSCVMINGPKNSGKSSLALYLKRRNFLFLSDDDGYVRMVRRRPFLCPCPTQIGARHHLLGKFKELRKYVLKGGGYGGKKRITTAAFEEQTQNSGSCYTCRLIVFPTYVPGGEMRIKKISPQEALNKLCKINSGFYPKPIRGKIFWAYHALSMSASAYTLFYDDASIERAAGLIEEKFSEAQ